MLDAQLLALLVCPATHQDVTLATPDEIGAINAAIGEGRMRTAAGKPVDQPVQAALIRVDRAVAYPIRDGIPVMLVAEGLALKEARLNAHG